MRFFLLFPILLLCPWCLAQTPDHKDILVQNKVKSVLEQHCFLNSESGSCMITRSTYDRRGNCIEWNMYRMNIIYRDVYNELNEHIMTLWVDKSDTTDIDTIFHHGSGALQTSSDQEVNPQTIYDKQGRLIKSTTESTNTEGNMVRVVKTRTYTDFGKLALTTRTSEIIETTKKSEYTGSTSQVSYAYDDRQNLILETHLENGEVVQSIRNEYDAQNRLIRKVDDDPRRVKSAIEMDYNGKESLTAFETRINYLENGQIDTYYSYFSDPCLSLGNHFLYKRHYLENSLLDYEDMFEEGRHIMKITHTYTYFD